MYLFDTWVIPSACIVNGRVNTQYIRLVGSSYSTVLQSLLMYALWQGTILGLYWGICFWNQVRKLDQITTEMNDLLVIQPATIG